MDRNVEMFLESYLVKDGSDVLKYNKLSEDSKEQITKDIVTSVYKSLRDKSLEIDYTMITATKGDITRLKDYLTLVNCIKFLEGMAKQSGIVVKELSTIRLAHDNLVAKKSVFIDAYRTENEMVVMLYNNIVMALVYAVSIVVLTMIDYSKQPNGSYEISFKSLDEGRKANNYIQALEDFNKMVVSGRLAKAATINPNKKNLTGGVMTLTGILLLMTMIIPIIRAIIHCFYQSRVNIAENLKTQAYFLEINMNDPTKVMNKATRDKQEKTIKKLLALSDKIDLKEKVTDRNVKSEIKDEDNEFTKQKISNNQVVTGGNAPSDDLLI